MNYLAHLFLSGNTPDLVLGNFIGDGVKGNALLDYPEKVQQGIILHRSIDSFTDQHAISASGKQRLYERHGKYAGIVLDIFYDHFLAVHWNKYHDEKLEHYVANTYQFLNSRKSEMPEKTKFLFHHMMKNNWLIAYTTFTGIDRTLTGMSRRTKFNSNMDQAIVELKKHYRAFEREFLLFFPEVIDFVKTQIDEFSQKTKD